MHFVTRKIYQDANPIARGPHQSKGNAVETILLRDPATGEVVQNSDPTAAKGTLRATEEALQEEQLVI